MLGGSSRCFGRWALHHLSLRYKSAIILFLRVEGAGVRYSRAWESAGFVHREISQGCFLRVSAPPPPTAGLCHPLWMSMEGCSSFLEEVPVESSARRSGQLYFEAERGIQGVAEGRIGNEYCAFCWQLGQQSRTCTFRKCPFYSICSPHFPKW